MRQVIGPVALLVALGCHFSWAQSVEKITEIEGISEYRLDNGCRVLLFPDPSKPLVTVNMTVFVGSRHEGYGETGMAHLLEHLMFKGTPSNREIPKSMKERGATNFNGTTWYDRTNYYETLPANEENLEWALRLEADRLVNSFISGEDLASEMTVVRNEFERGENDPRRILMQRIMATAYEWHNYGKMTIGNRADIERVPISNLRAFYEKFYRVDNIMVVVAGQFDTDRAIELVLKHFGAIQPPAAKIPDTYTQEPTQDGERIVYLRRVGDVPLIGAGYHIPAASHPDYPAVEVLSNVLGMRPSGRLYKELVEQKLAARANSSEIVGHDPGMLLCFAEVPSGVDPAATQDALLSCVESVGQSSVSDEETRRAVAELEKQREDLLADTESLAIELSEWAAYGDWRLFFLHRDRLEKVTAADVRRVAKSYLIPSNRTLGIFLPTSEPVRARIPETPPVAQMVADYQGRETVAQGESFDTSADYIESRVTRGRLESGMKFAFLPKKTKGEKVLVSLRFRFGNEQGLNEGSLNTACDLLADLMVRGTRDLSHAQIVDRFRELKTTLSQTSSTGEADFELEGRRSTIVEALRILQQILREPTFPDPEFEILRRQQVTQIEARKSEPMVKGVETLRRRLMPYPRSDIRYVPTSEERIENLNRLQADDVRTVYERFFGGGHGELVVVGDFDPEEIRPVLEEMLRHWTADEPYEHIDNSVRQLIAAESVVIETPDKPNAMFAAGVALPIRDDDDAYEAMMIGNNILGGGALSNRLANRVRQQDGLSYTVGSQFSADHLDQRGTFIAFAIMNPENRDKLLTAIDEEFQRILDSGVSEDELAKAKIGVLEQMRVGRGEDQNLAEILARQLAADRDMSFVKRRESRIEGLTKQQVDQAVRRMIDAEHMVQVTAGNFAAGGANGDDESATDPKKKLTRPK
jgi:zinc protease